MDVGHHAISFETPSITAEVSIDAMNEIAFISATAPSTEHPIFIQPLAPISPPDVYIWIQTGLGDGGGGFTLWFEDGEV